LSNRSNSPPSNQSRVLATVFLDRDGVLNRKLPEGSYIASWEDFHLLPGVPRAIYHLNRAGIRVLVVSNQRGIALGLHTAADVLAIHAKLQALLQQSGAHIDALYFCPHDTGQCDCRKPLPGLFHQAVAEFPDIAADTSAMIGDSLSDIEFGHLLGMRTVFVDGDPIHQKPGASAAGRIANQRVADLPEAIKYLLDTSATRSRATPRSPAT
jgi:D-glycero-D-manno-heptose 1,7-bisphosphate phosphatase